MNRMLQFVILTAILTLDSRTDAATTAAVKFCGRQLSEIMTRVCHAYNSPSWDVPTVEQPSRRKRQVGIADECCIIGCTWEQLSEYCSVSAFSESPLEEMESHIIADRSAEQAKAAAVPAPAAVGNEGEGDGNTGRDGAGKRGRIRGKAGRRRRCWCRRKRRSGRRRSSLMGPRKKCAARCSRRRNRITPNHVGPDPKH